MTMPASDIHNLSIGDASRLIRARQLSPVDLLEAVLKRIEAVDERIKSYLLLDVEGARAKARKAEDEIAAGRWLGPLHGIPYGAKDNYFTKSLRTSANSRVLLDHVPDFDAAIIERLNAAGAILVGKLNTWEYGTGLGQVYHDAAFPHSRNPWKEEYFTGGSSTGSGASVAAGTALFSLGSDTGGSIRAPAAACGLQGLKPTYGLVSRYGILPNSWSLDVPGPLAWTIEDCAIVMQAIAGFDPRDPATVKVDVPDYSRDLESGCQGLVIGVIRDVGDGIASDPAVQEGLEDLISALAKGGARVVETQLPAPPASYRELTALLSGSERACVHEADFRDHADLMGRELREAIMAGSAARAVDYLAAQRRRSELAKAVDGVVASYDAIVLPGAHHTAPPFSDPDRVRRFMTDSVTTAFNISGHPALATRTGFDAEGLPTSAQIVGRYFDEATVLRVGRSYERARSWHERRPTL